MALIASLGLEFVVLLALYEPRPSLIMSTASKVRCRAHLDLTVFILSLTSLINLQIWLYFIMPIKKFSALVIP